jgi:hypothetical protein
MALAAPYIMAMPDHHRFDGIERQSMQLALQMLQYPDLKPFAGIMVSKFLGRAYANPGGVAGFSFNEDGITSIQRQYIGDPETMHIFSTCKNMWKKSDVAPSVNLYCGEALEDIQENLEGAIYKRLLMETLATWNGSEQKFYQDIATKLITCLAPHDQIIWSRLSSIIKVPVEITDRMKSYYAGLQRQYALFARDKLGMTEAEITERTRFRF